MRVAIFTVQEYVFLFSAWERLIPEIKKKHDIVGLWIFPERLGRLVGWRVPWWYLYTLGIKTVFKLGFKTLQARFKTKGSYASLCKAHGIPLLHGRDPNDIQVIEWLRANSIDVVPITINHLLKLPMIQAVRIAVLNRHSSLLPAYRGIFPVVWTLLDGKIPVGATVHCVDDKIDHGQILAQRAYPDFKGSVYDAYMRIYQGMPELFMDAFHALETREKTMVDLAPEPSYRSLPTRKDIRQLRAKGINFV